MAKVWTIVEVPYTQTNAWVMAVWAKVVGQVNGLFFQNLKYLFHLEPQLLCDRVIWSGAKKPSDKSKK